MLPVGERKKVGRWKPINAGIVGLMSSLSAGLMRIQLSDPDWLPYLGDASDLWIVADCAGTPNDPFEVLSFLITADDERLEPWFSARTVLRQRYFPGDPPRRFSYKGLNGDALKRKALEPFLAASETIPGVLITLAIDTRIPSLFFKDKRERFELAKAHEMKPVVFERTLRFVHLISCLVAGFSYPGQNILWINDQDSILSNERQADKVAHIWNGILRHYLSHSLGELRFATTVNDPGDLHIEDLASIPDIPAGATLEMLRKHSPGDKVVMAAHTRTNAAMRWLGSRRPPLAKRHARLTRANDPRGETLLEWITFDVTDS
jgi:hypothetical protein